MYYDDIAGGYDELHGAEQERKLRVISAELSLKPCQKLLDVGCGSGISFKFFNCERVGVDSSKELLGKVEGGVVVEGRAEELPFQDGFFDAVICVTAIHNFEDPEKALDEMLRVGRDSFVVSVLKKSLKRELLERLLREKFRVVKVVDEGVDVIYFLKRRVEE